MTRFDFVRAAARFAVFSSFFVAAVSSTMHAADVTAPGDPITGTSTNVPGVNEAVDKAIDNIAGTKYLNFDKLNTGFTVTPSTTGVPVIGLGLISANDAPVRDPASYTLEGSNDGVNFSPISSGAVGPFAARFEIQQIGFANASTYQQYRVIFPTVFDAGAANSMQIAEVQLLRALDLTLPTDVVTASSANIPGVNEDANKVIDNLVGTKYLNFDKLNTGFTVVANGGIPSIVSGIGLISANDAPERDPASYVLEGSNDGVNFSMISSGAVNPFAARFATQDILFANSSAYSTYRVTFPTVANELTANSMQIAEVQLYGTPVPEPSTCVLAALGLGGLLAIRRRAKR
ncbi:MAG: PEP-CTERM sorting domain-containing protein [Pirellulales bacterium]